MVVRALTTGDEGTLRSVRLRALADAPEQFTSTYDREADRSDADWGRWFAPGATFVADDDGGSPVGMVAAVPDDDAPGTAHLMALWVDPAVRGTGVGDELVAIVLDWAAGHAMACVHLHVMADNRPARLLYERHGFVAVAEIERDGVTQTVMERR
ncbi:MAG TPA: GNAT family N-acetyltransferase [Acidimicrobiales bacterium]|nr:GNAT family N-acetyltransferase [Acidimicrobiales bacterium]